MISLIKSRITRNTFDDVMEVAWATMWNVTDETPINCQRFLDLDGMKHFISCLKVSEKSQGAFVLSCQIKLSIIVFFRNSLKNQSYCVICWACWAMSLKYLSCAPVS